MSRTQLTPAQLQQLHDLAPSGSKIIARRTGDDSDLDLVTMGKSPGGRHGPSRRHLQCLLQRQADALVTSNPAGLSLCH